MSEEIKVGDVVELKSGGPCMTVWAIQGGDDNTFDVVYCMWFTEPVGEQAAKPAKDKFYPHVLKKLDN